MFRFFLCTVLIDGCRVGAEIEYVTRITIGKIFKSNDQLDLLPNFTYEKICRTVFDDDTYNWKDQIERQTFF